MYEFQLIMNPPKSRVILDDKTLFYRKYKGLIKHMVSDISDLQNNHAILETILNNPSGKIVFKVANGKCGRNVFIGSSRDFNKSSIASFMKKNGYDLVEDYSHNWMFKMKLRSLVAGYVFL
jgi:glutathione synthase/RimK-type ligase-like ATP-grasp enzyme